MKALTVQQAQNIVSTLQSKQATNSSNINVVTVMGALASVAATTFATLTQASPVQCNKDHKDQEIFKITVQNVTLCNSNASLYSNAVTREVIATGQAADFTALPSNYVMLNNSYSVCALKSDTNKHYLRATVNKPLSVAYYCARTNTLLTKAQVAQVMRPADAKKLLAPSKPNSVQHAGIEHNVTVRNFALRNIYGINLAQQQLVC